MNRTTYARPLCLLLPLGAVACGGLYEDEDAAYYPGSTNNSNTSYAPPEAVADPDPGARSFNPFVEAAHDPFSTFAADVDTASYEIFVKSMEQGAGTPAPSTVRSEEFVNFFPYDYPAPSSLAADPFEIDLDLGPSPSGDTMLLRVGVQGKDILADRADANLVFLVDVSGSMGAQDKLPVAKQMLIDALDHLRPTDKVSMVTYAGSVRVALPPTSVDQRATIVNAIQHLDAGGSTAGADGLRLAYDQAVAGFVEGGINHIVMCTDGDFNVGPYTTQEILDIVETRRQTGVTFTAIGFGLGNLNDQMMEAVSNAGNGIYRVISGPKTAARYVQFKLLSDVAHIAKDVKLQVEFNPDYVYAYRQVGYENRQLADDQFRDDTVDAGEIGSGHQMTALYEVVLVEGVMPNYEGAPEMQAGEPVEGEREILDGELVMVKLRYKQPGASETDPATEMRVALGPDDGADTLGSESEFAWAVAAMAGRVADNPFAPEDHLLLAGPILSSQTRADRAQLYDLYTQLGR